MKLHLFALVFILILTGCPLDDGSGNGDHDWVLPAAVGTNEIGGRIWFSQDTHEVIVSYAVGGTYAKSIRKRAQDGGYDLDENGSYTYRSIETGVYSWNETDTTIIHKPEATLFNQDINNTELLNRKEYRQAIEEQINGWPWFAGWIGDQGLSKNEYITSRLDTAFAGWYAGYTIIGEALLMQEALPANAGQDDLSGKTYQHREDSEEYYIFVKSGSAYTYTFEGTTRDYKKRSITGAFAYNGGSKKVYLKPLTVDGKTLLEWYNSIEPYEGHNFPSDTACKAALTNQEFQLIEKSYNPQPQGEYQGTVSF